MKGNKKLWGTVLIEKILDVIDYCFPGEEKKQLKNLKKDREKK